MQKTIFSDHNLITAITNKKKNKQITAPEDCLTHLRSLNFNSKSIKWEALNSELKSINWDNMMSNKDSNQMLETLTDKVYQLCTAHVPPKIHQRKGGNNTIPSDKKILMKKRAKLSKKLKIM